MQHEVGPPCPPPNAYGPRKRVGEPRRCRECRRELDPFGRRSVCRGCVRDRDRGATVNGPCAVCALADRRMLSVVDVQGSPVVLCCNDQALLVPPVLTLEHLRTEARFRSEGRAAFAELRPAAEAGAVQAA